MKVVVIGCGGLGINVAASLAKQFEGADKENIEFLLIDGSDSNMIGKEGMDDIFWKVPNIDGAGKVRKQGATQYMEFVKSNASKIPQANMYILVYSLSGGSGSVLGPTLNLELMKKGALTANVVLATDNSSKDVENTFNTLSGLANNVRQLGRPIHFCVEESSTAKPSEIDAMLSESVIELMRICGERHMGLDSNDVRSFLDYQTHGIAPALTMIERFDDASAMKELEGAAITTLSLLTDNDNARPDVGAVFNTDGICSSSVDTHFVTTTKNMDSLSRKIKERHDYYKGTAQGLNLSDSFGCDSDDALVL